ncbi:MAG: hypothetical protein WDW38_010878 [Sanguina aurantia]
MASAVLSTVCVQVIGILGYVTSKIRVWLQLLDSECNAPLATVLVDPTSATPMLQPSITNPPSKALSIIIPAYNEEERLGPSLDEILEYLKERRNRQGVNFTYEVIIVDDGSTDRTASVAMQYVHKHGVDTVRLLKVLQNRGKGHAVKRGMLIARGEYCLFADADGATKVTELEKLEDALALGMKADFSAAASSSSSAARRRTMTGSVGAAFGSRAHLERDAVVKRSRLRNFLMHGFHLLVTMVAGSQLRDTQCGFKLFTRRAAASLFSNQRIQRWVFDVELVFLADQLGVPITEVFVAWTEMPGSKIRFHSIITMALELLVIKVAYAWMGLWRVNSEAEVLHSADSKQAQTANKSA